MVFGAVRLQGEFCRSFLPFLGSEAQMLAERGSVVEWFPRFQGQNHALAKGFLARDEKRSL